MKQTNDLRWKSGKFSALHIIICVISGLILSGCYTYRHDRGRHLGHRDRVVVVVPNGTKYGSKHHVKQMRQREKVLRKQEKARRKYMKEMRKHQRKGHR